MVARAGGFDEITTQQKVNISVMYKEMYIYICINAYNHYNVCI